MEQVCDLTVIFTRPPEGSPSEVIASIEVRCEAPQLTHLGDLLIDPVTPQEQRDLLWYLEEYWKWPYEQFLERGKQVEALLRDLGKRLFETAFRSPDAKNVVQAWRLHPGTQYQISIVSDLPNVLSLPWELLHDEQGFLAVGGDTSGHLPALIIRHLSQCELSEISASFEPPLRILLVTARPEDLGFVDPRSIARELVEEMGQQVEAGDIEVEFLRPPTVEKLRTRLSDRRRPVHVLHFDGHGVFDERQEQQGMLAFENEGGGRHLVKASDVREVLHQSGVRLAVLTACQSAVSKADDALSSVAAQLLQGNGGVDAAVAMSASVLVSTAARYAEAFYRALATGLSVQMSHQRAQRALYHDPLRHPHRRRLDEEGIPVSMQDWWVPHFYQQRFLIIEPMKSIDQRQQRKPYYPSPLPPSRKDMPAAPRYGFSGRASELLQIERTLLRRRLVVLHGFGGVGKTALAREAADWLIQTKMYDRACFVSFEHGGDATILLRQLGVDLNIYDSHYDPNDIVAALEHLEPLLKQRHLLVIADNMESILPSGGVPLTRETRTELYDVLLELRKMGAGVLLTCRGTAFDDPRLASSGSQVTYIALGGLHPEDAYSLASTLLDKLKIDRASIPYLELTGLLTRLDYHPLAIQLVLPALRERSITMIKSALAVLSTDFVDDEVTGHNKSLLASLNCSLRLLNEDQRLLLSFLAPFQGGANQHILLRITGISPQLWAGLCLKLEETALLTVSSEPDDFYGPFLHFHPVLTPFLRAQSSGDDPTRYERYIQWYVSVAKYLYHADDREPLLTRSLVQHELPNFLNVLKMLLAAGKVETATEMALHIDKFLDFFGRQRQQDELHQLVQQSMAAVRIPTKGRLTLAEYQREFILGDGDIQKGNVDAAYSRFMSLLERIETQQEDTPIGHASHEHFLTLTRIARCLEAKGQFSAAEVRLRQALEVIDAFISLQAGHQDHQEFYIHQRSSILADMGDVLLRQGRYQQSQKAYEESLEIATRQCIQSAKLVARFQLGTLALIQQKYAEAQSSYEAAREIAHILKEPKKEANIWHQLGAVAQEQEDWSEAERCYRESLILKERYDNKVEAISTYNQLGAVVMNDGRYSEAEGWWQQGLILSEQTCSGSPAHAMILNNLAGLLMTEVQERRKTQADHNLMERLAEARNYAEHALAIRETMERGHQTEIWHTLHILAQIAHMEGHLELAKAYRHRERETFAAFEGNRSHTAQKFGEIIATIANTMKVTPEVNENAEIVLSAIDRGLAVVARRIWLGEREWQSLVEDLDPSRALFVLLLLETLA